MLEFLKYFSPVAVLGIIWAIVQFYQKRNFEKKDIIRSEKLNVYKKLHYHSNQMYTAIIVLQDNVGQNTYALKTKDKIQTTKQEKLLNELEKAQDEIRNKKNSDNRYFDLELEIKNQEERISELKIILNETSKFLEEKDQIYRDDVRNLILKLKAELRKINSIPLLIPYSTVELINLNRELTSLITKMVLPIENDDFRVGTEEFVGFNDNITVILKHLMRIDQILFNELT